MSGRWERAGGVPDARREEKDLGFGNHAFVCFSWMEGVGLEHSFGVVFRSLQGMIRSLI